MSLSVFLPMAFAISAVFGFATASQPIVTASVFNAEQADAGRTAYSAHCASCHTADLGGRDDAPALAGESFMATWKSKTTKELFEFVRDTMPPEGATLKPVDYVNIVAHMLKENGATAGPQPLTATTAVPIGSIATGQRPGIARSSVERITLAPTRLANPPCTTSGAASC